MTIAACYLSAEGVVLGADSTTTMYVAGPGAQVPVEHHYNFAQKVFEIGANSTLAFATWGLGNVGTMSFRTLVARLGDSFVATPPSSVLEAAQRWANLFWTEFIQLPEYQLIQKLSARAQSQTAPTSLSDDEKKMLFLVSSQYSGGFCIGGHGGAGRTPEAYEIVYSALDATPPTPVALKQGVPKFWGCPNIITRMVFGMDPAALVAIMNTGKWTGTSEELVVAASQNMLGQPRMLPIRDAIDWVHASIYATIKTFKFSHFAPICGGPIEVAVVTSDRPFRWVRHKKFAAAIDDGTIGDDS